MQKIYFSGPVSDVYPIKTALQFVYLFIYLLWHFIWVLALYSIVIYLTLLWKIWSSYSAVSP